MLIEIGEKQFKHYFPVDPHPFISQQFIKLNKKKVDNIVWLAKDTNKPEIGLVAGINEKKLLSPFSAPFGGFHYKKENVYSNVVDNFISSLKEYYIKNNLEELKITLPPDIYQASFNAKCVSALYRKGFKANIPEITSWVNLYDFEGRFCQKNSREYYRQALRNNLVFEYTNENEEKEIIYEIIAENRKNHNRPIFMTLDDINNTGNIWPVDFFKVSDENGNPVASAIFYRFTNRICFPLFWGDNDEGRPLRAMDFLIFNLLSYYKNLGFKYMDLGISTEESVPNSGLLRFKEAHEAVSSLRFTFTLNSIK